MKIRRNNNTILFNNAVLSYNNMKLKDKLGREWTLPENLDDVYYITITDNYKENDAFLSCYRNGIIKDFLVKRDCYYKFITNAINRINESGKSRTSFIDSLISAFFIWRLTPEGHDFWSKISYDFINYIHYENQKRKE